MARYFFHTENGFSQLDREGTELDSPLAAQLAAVKLMGESLKNEPEEMLASRTFKVIVTDATGLILFSLDLSALESPALAGRNRG